jgi:hypothetical protein
MRQSVHAEQLENFREYLRTLPDDLLAGVTQDYMWLTDLPFKKGPLRTGLQLRRDCCLEECALRRVPRFCRSRRSRPPEVRLPVRSQETGR